MTEEQQWYANEKRARTQDKVTAIIERVERAGVKFTPVDYTTFKRNQLIYVSTDPQEEGPFEITFLNPAMGEVLIKDSYYFPEPTKAVLVGSELNQQIIPGLLVRFGSLVITVNRMRIKETGPDLIIRNVKYEVPGTTPFDVWHD